VSLTCHSCVCADAVPLHGCYEVTLKQARWRLCGTLTQRHLQQQCSHNLQPAQVHTQCLLYRAPANMLLVLPVNIVQGWGLPLWV
jgi:hypothetical protein